MSASKESWISEATFILKNNVYFEFFRKWELEPVGKLVTMFFCL